VSEAGATVTPVDTDEWLTDTRVSYDTVATSYADRMRGALCGAPYLRAALALFAEAIRGDGDGDSTAGGPVADVGCGPGHVTAHLRELGLDAFGIDLSPAMIDVARRDYPGVRFEVGSMTALDLADASIAGLLSCWSLVHIPDHELPGVFTQFRRVLRPGGLLVVGFHAGEGSKLKTEGYGGHPMNVYVHRRQPDQLADLLRAAGFAIEAQFLLDPDGTLPEAILFARNQSEHPEI
jgi:SAM-dependent methyltransferase